MDEAGKAGAKDTTSHASANTKPAEELTSTQLIVKQFYQLWDILQDTEKVLVLNMSTSEFRISYPCTLKRAASTQESGLATAAPGDRGRDSTSMTESVDGSQQLARDIAPAPAITPLDADVAVAPLSQDNNTAMPSSHSRVVFPLDQYDLNDPPLLASDHQYMIVPLPRWSRVLEFNWKSDNYGLTEAEKKLGKTVVIKRKVMVPEWVWLEDGLGDVADPAEWGGGLFKQVWVHRGGA